MALGDDLIFQRIEMLLDMQQKKLLAEIHSLKEELQGLKDDFHKHASERASAPAPQPVYQQQPPQWQQQAPQAAGYPPQGGYAQQPAQHWEGQFGAAQAPHIEQPQVARGFAQPSEKAPESRPIDRNGVAPSEVSIEKFFYMGNKKSK